MCWEFGREVEIVEIVEIVIIIIWIYFIYFYFNLNVFYFKVYVISLL